MARALSRTGRVSSVAGMRRSQIPLAPGYGWLLGAAASLTLWAGGLKVALLLFG